MFNVVRKEMQWGNAKLVLETGKIARQADGAVKVTYGETVVLCTAVGAKQPRPDVDFFPLTVNYQEKAFAAGKIPGGFFKREGRPSEKETLVSRLIDRPIRPLFHPQYRNDTQIVCTVLSHDMENDPDVVAMIGTSAALTISGLPFLGPIGAARVGYKDGEYLLNPSTEAVKESDLDLVVAGTRDGVMMVESEASELSEDIMLGAVKFGHEQFQGVLDLIIELAEEAAKEPREVAGLPDGYDALVEKVAALGTESLTAAYANVVKQERSAAVAAAKAEIVEKLGDEVPDELKGKVSSIIKDLEKDIVRGAILKTGKRIDGRTGADVRPILGEVSVLPRSHGSSIFTRGETQALAVVTLGTGQDEQIVDALDGEYREGFMLHYNFPPYSVGEAGRMGSPGRREIGHGKLAWRALHPLMPSKEAFPYTTRIVSEVTESNGSSSMATVCASSLAMMDAGVPLARPVAGIAMGLIKEAEDFAVLSDIMGDEDHLGDMDFKVAGTENGITSLQMDIKITSVTAEIMQIALKQARDGRLHILGEMSKALPEARGEVSGNAPTITQFSIPKDKIRDVIGSGGKVIREICEETGAKVDIEDDGSITVAHTDGAKGKQAVDWIKSIVAEPELNHIYDGKVVKAVDFGAFVNFFGARDGLVHISELAPERVKQVSDIVKEGDQVKVKVIGFDDRGKIKLSMKRVDQETGADLDAGDAE
ncbi:MULTISPECIES: polyribonucleotide nucleotidyltransferase [Thalassospira]|jgi:polyribonucleotide nucleotidyltransferase|uniref:Polyribonucleotide nucleotidyltransferase n=1 Tax=Thalassospira profundimaris TaxID=502049 RepID=A0A367VFV7_9PROT|nr:MULTISPECIES: polyribonucleotide nucleotidyltransferase [Thalassospira]KZB71592.1 polyribonucleotide nucleotidyltransferase [Thalassospira sp. MCCC 1A01148]MBR9898660.1 polyribonucleotide nucleotidyltransferase [Rhodospirillales bacterium]MBS8275837.1 polyribonucleotide nucleotidyltransferase [Thalassospira tepidiphila]RCK24076.1 polynucleotide phosphorylase/polyadenylase [Thalassospira profundimaris]